VLALDLAQGDGIHTFQGRLDGPMGEGRASASELPLAPRNLLDAGGGRCWHDEREHQRSNSDRIHPEYAGP
jgi:hypothetical protein